MFFDGFRFGALDGMAELAENPLFVAFSLSHPTVKGALVDSRLLGGILDRHSISDGFQDAFSRFWGEFWLSTPIFGTFLIVFWHEFIVFRSSGTCFQTALVLAWACV